MIGLLNDRYVPITNSFGFLRCRPEEAVAAFLDWQVPIQEKRGVRLQARPVAGDLGTCLASLLPLTSVEARRHLFLATDSAWTAFVDNGHHGTDAVAPVSVLAELLACPGIRASDAAPGVTQGGTILELYGARAEGPSNTIRSIYAAPTDGKWSFGTIGTVQDFEDTSLYAMRRIRDRFNSQILSRYLAAMGIRAFDPAFYGPGGTLVEKTGPAAPAMQEFGLTR